MPQGENFWNPYRWVPVYQKEVARATPAYRHRWQGLSGRLDCTLKALTPFLIGSSKEPGQFIRSGLTNQPFIPGTSLKGLIRSLAELIGNAAIPFPNGRADPGHRLEKAAEGEGVHWRLDIAARMFGYLHGGRVFAGLVRFTDGVLQDNKVKEIGPFTVVVGQPRPDEHKPFYPDEKRRKFYHHHVNTDRLVAPPPSIRQTRSVRPLAPGTRFTFQVHFENLREEELNLLLYCLVLEENVSVTLSKGALGPDAQEPVTLTGPLRHKFGGCKPQGGGSVQITIDKMALYADRADRYRGQAAPPRILEGEELKSELQRQTQAIAARQDNTMQHLRAMLIYSPDDPRRPIEYPSYDWFNDSQKSSQPLKPTL
jgi:CRISPR/Cas system CSM-associated protein Csm3 (group 7 of RAMP superfamily)